MTDITVDKFEEAPFFNVARTTRVGNLVINVEVANQEWIDTHQTDPWFYFPVSPGKDGNPAHIGLHYDPETGLFEQPPVPEEPMDGAPEVKRTARKKA